MFNPFDHEDDALDEAIASVFDDLKTLKPSDEGYRPAAKQLSELYALKYDAAKLILQAQEKHAAHQLEADKNTWQEEQDERPFYERIDPNTALTVAGSLLTALIVVKYEKTGVISSKALNFMRKF